MRSFGRAGLPVLSHRRNAPVASNLRLHRQVQAFEARARECGCSSFHLETFNFQAPAPYQALGYTVACEHKVYPHGIVGYVMVKHEPGNQNAA